MPQPKPTIRNFGMGSWSLYWQEVGILTAQEAALAVDERTDTYIESIAATKRIVYQRRTCMPWMECRFRFGGTDGQAGITHMYAMSGYGDYWNYMGQLEMHQGLQECGSLYFADTPTPAAENAFFEAVEYNAADGIGRYCWKAKNYSRFLWIASTIACTSITIDVREMHNDYAVIPGKT